MGTILPDKINSTDKPPSLFDRYFYLILSGTILIALILRITALLSLKESVYFDFLLWDERLYHTWAEKIAGGTFQSSSVYEMAPLPAYLMALIYKILSPDVLYIRIANIVFGVLTCYLVYLIGKELANRTVGLFACLIACFYKPFIFYSIVPLKTSLSLSLFAAMVYLFVAVLNKPSLIKSLALGVVMGLVQNVRPNCIVLTPLLPLLIVWVVYKKKTTFKVLTVTLIFYALGLCLSNAPFIIRNYRVAGKTSATVSQSGFNLYMCNNLEYGYPLPFATTSPFDQGIQFTIEASRRSGKKLTPGEASSYWTNEVIKTALEQPKAFMWRIFRKVLAVFNRHEKGDHYHMGFLSNFVAFFKFPFPGICLILPIGMAGMAIKMFGSRKSSALAAIFLVYASTLIAFFINIRVRLPLLVILIPFAAVGINCVVSYIEEKQLEKIAIFLIVTISFFIIAFIPMRRSGDMTAYYNTHAIILDSKGLENEAIAYWEKSSRMKRHYSPFADLSLAKKYYNKNDIPRALNYLENISEDSFAASHKYTLTGDIMMQQKQIEKAVEAYEKSLEINSGHRRTRKKLIKTLLKTDKKRATEEYKKLKYISSFYDLY
ncbi:MAG: tetratricopeptide repeat protein [Deltaproteobacteria bacterium]|nr:tetratricopeptide repeat protein [Deltaproteobacteria bacterium]